MKLYTLAEVVEDVCKFEQVTCQITDELEKARFLKLYSEFYEKPLGDQMTVNDLTKRMQEFLHAENVMLPPCDVFPDDKSKFWIYKVKVSDVGAIVLTENMTLLNTSNSENETKDIALDGIEVGYRICVVSARTSTIDFFERMLH